MLAALLCNLESAPAVGPILREQGYASISRDVQKAAKRIEEILSPSLIPGSIKAKIKRSAQTATEISALPDIHPLAIGNAIIATQSAMLAAQNVISELQPQEWMIELRLILEQLTFISVSLNDDEEALLLLM